MFQVISCEMVRDGERLSKQRPRASGHCAITTKHGGWILRNDKMAAN